MDTTAPATKADISMIMEAIGRLYAASERWKNELQEEVDQQSKKLKDGMRHEMRIHKEQIKQHFDVVTENLKHDFWGIHKDKISVLNDQSHDHKERLIVIEKQLAIRLL